MAALARLGSDTIFGRLEKGFVMLRRIRRRCLEATESYARQWKLP